MPKEPEARPSIRQAYAYDRSAMADGRWFPLAGGEVRVARDGNPKHMAAIASAAEGFAPGHKLTPDDQQMIRRKAAAEAILLEWRGFDEPYTRSAAERLMEEQPDFLNDVMQIAVNRERYRSEAVETAGPN